MSSAVAATPCSWGQSLDSKLTLWHSTQGDPEAFWQRKRQAARADDDVRFNDVIIGLPPMSDGQVPSVPVEMLDDGDD